MTQMQINATYLNTTMYISLKRAVKGVYWHSTHPFSQWLLPILASSELSALEPKVGVLLSQPDNITIHGVHHQINTFADEDTHVKAASMENMSNGQKK
ncbi:hypothetical protein DACRYDRAFT_107531 [Dacryopinax primogenitus]|uniref:Uncharacterized protein n=1 Tax=Dacryopinax primogenitus (strain DJM 731) TaxID=1858805 RepID=M5FVG4_DACPD|nr:uncharacterized protein DACRYDRAFT_107531 [Dacryopinax primogenitus]EJU01796.1 hypothetical protein DACRYDRAFT_107531 [Dacryopinax primogenitus]